MNPMLRLPVLDSGGEPLLSIVGDAWMCYSTPICLTMGKAILEMYQEGHPQK